MDQDKFIAAVASQKAVGIQDTGETIGEGLDKFIAFFMSVSVVDIFQIVQVKHHYANTECAWAVAQLLNKLFQRCFVVNAGDIPECIYDKT